MTKKRIISKVRYLRYIFKNYHNYLSIIAHRIFSTPLTTVKLRNGLVIQGFHNSNILTIADEIFFKKIYLKGKLDIKPGDVVLDIGGHVGIFTLFALYQGAGKVYTFEPTPQNIKIIKENMKVNSYKNIEVINKAVAGKSGEVKLYINTEDSGNTLSEVGYNGQFENYINVSSTTLEKIFKRYSLGQVDFMKLDCEGSEGHIIASTPSYIWKKIRQVSLEFHNSLSVLSYKDIEQKLKSLGFCTLVDYQRNSPIGYIYAWRP